jgi:hypothetical protein
LRRCWVARSEALAEGRAARLFSLVKNPSMNRLLPTDAWVRWLLVPALVFIALATNTAWLADFWHHLARGREIVSRGELLDHDIFTFTVPGREFQDVNWLTQVGYYLLYQAGGLDLVRVVNAALVAATLLWLVALCRRVSGSLGAALGVGIFTFLGLWHILSIRPQTLSLMLFVALYDLLEHWAAGEPKDEGERMQDEQKNDSSFSLQPSSLVLAVPMLALWANVHGAFPAGIMLLGCYGLAALWRWWRAPSVQTRGPVLLLGVVGMAAILATLINPYGWDIYLYVGQTSHRATERRIDEWLPPRLDQLIGVVFYVSLPLFAGLCIAAWRKRGQRLAAHEWLLIACFLPLALGSVRMVAWWLLVIAPMAARRLTSLWPGAKDSETAKPNVGAAVSCAVLAALVVLSLPALQRFNPLLALRPADPTLGHVREAVEVLKRDVGRGNVFTRFEWGEYLSWAAHPDFKVFMDGRIEIYPHEVWDAYTTLTRGKPGWEKVLDDYGVDVLLLDEQYHRGTGLYSAIEKSEAWRLHFKIEGVVVFVRRT